MLIKLPRTGPGVRYVDSSCIKLLAVVKQQETARDAPTYNVSLMDDKQKELATIKCVSSDAADALMDTIATLVNFSPYKTPPIPAFASPEGTAAG